MQEFGKTIIVVGLVLIILGILLSAYNKIPLIGKLPGDIFFQKNGITFYFPLATSIILSIILSVIFYLLKR